MSDQYFGFDPATRAKSRNLEAAERMVRDIEGSFIRVKRPDHINAHLRWVIERNQLEYQPQYFREHVREWGTCPA